VILWLLLLLGLSKAPTRHTIEIRGMEFHPAELTVAVGDTIVWINRDIVPHTATASGRTKWDTRPLSQGQIGLYVARRAGTTSYVCTLHPTMHGTLIVKEPASFERANPRPLDPALVRQGREIFRHSTFGDEAFWTDIARMHEVITSVVSPAVALSVGLQVDAEALPQSLKNAKETYTGEGPVSYWNAYVAVTQMHGRGNFRDDRLGIDVRSDPDFVTPLRGLWQHAPYFHDGSAATLGDVVEHYDRVLELGLSAQQRADLVAFLKTL